MKTTLDVRDDLLLRAKKLAVEERRTLRSVVEQGLRAVLDGPPPPRTSARKKIRWVTVRGGLPPGVDVADREALHAWLGSHGRER